MKRISKKINKSGIKINIKSKTLWISAIIFILVQIFVTIQTSALGAKLSKLERNTSEITELNQKLKDELINSSSLSRLEEKAESLGYSNLVNTLYIYNDEIVAKAP